MDLNVLNACIISLLALTSKPAFALIVDTSLIIDVSFAKMLILIARNAINHIAYNVLQAFKTINLPASAEILNINLLKLVYLANLAIKIVCIVI